MCQFSVALAMCLGCLPRHHWLSSKSEFRSRRKLFLLQYFLVLCSCYASFSFSMMPFLQTEYHHDTPILNYRNIVSWGMRILPHKVLWILAKILYLGLIWLQRNFKHCSLLTTLRLTFRHTPDVLSHDSFWAMASSWHPPTQASFMKSSYFGLVYFYSSFNHQNYHSSFKVIVGMSAVSLRLGRWVLWGGLF